MHRRLLIALALAGGTALLSNGGAAAQVADGSPHPGAALFQAQCAACHEAEDNRAPRIASLRVLSAEQIGYALTQGTMAMQGAALSPEDRARVIDYLAAQPVAEDAWLSANLCTSGGRRVSLEGVVAMRMPGVDLAASRNLTSAAAGLEKADLERLELAWAIGFPGVSGLRAAPVIIGSILFYSATSTGRLLAVDAPTGCIHWVYDAGVPLRSSVSLAVLDDSGREALFLADGRGQIHAVDPETGAQIWVASGRVDEGSGMLTGSVVVYDGIVIVPISASGVSAGANDEFECCVGRGAVAALDAATGRRLWNYVTMEEADYTGRVSSTGIRQRGPSGAPIWSTPSIDPERRRVYVTTGENTSLPATGTSDAIIALDLDTGEALWVFQATANDVWHMGCGARPGPNCPSPEESILRDWDFGSSAVLVELPDGRDILLAGQKSGQLWALDPEDGSLLWEQRVGEGGALGGNHWGIAVDGERVFLPISDPGGGANRMPGLYAFDIATGFPLWEQALTPACEGERGERVPGCMTRFGLSATPIVVDGAVVTAGIDGRVHIFDGVDGRLLFQFDTARPFETINGVEGSGGSIDAHSIAAGAGMIFVGSGYGSFSQMPGNLLLGFRPRPE